MSDGPARPDTNGATVAPAGRASDVDRAVRALASDASSFSLELADVASNVEAISDAAVAQTAAFEQIRAATVALLETTRATAGSAQEAGDAARQATTAARESAQRIAASLEDVQSLARWSAGAAEQLRAIVQVLADLRQATGKLDAIAQQTRILSLNARIEAARSGVHGLGFGVIADNVRGLADGSAATTQQIDERMRELVLAVDRLASGGTAAAEQAARVELGSEQIREELDRVGDAVAVADARVEVIAVGAVQAEAALGDVEGAIESVAADADEQTNNLTQARDRINGLRHLSERVMAQTAGLGVDTVDARMIELTRAGAARFERLFEQALADGELTMSDLFDDDYTLISGSNPEQYRTRHCAVVERIAPLVQEPILESDPAVRGACLHDRNGHRPMMNVCFSQPQRSDPAWNAKHARSKGFATDAAGLAASRNTKPVLLQVYRRTATGVVELTKDASVPVFVRGRHWGSLRTVYVDAG